MTIVGTRPELIKLSRVISEADRHFEQILVHTGQNYDYELNQIFFDDLGIRKPDFFLDVAKSTAAKTIAEVISKSDDLLGEVSPDAFLIYGDTNSCLSAISAKRHRVPVFHMEAGNRCFDERVPEEINRRILDHISDINMPLTEHGRRYLIAEGIRPETIIRTGSCMPEVLEHQRGAVERSDVLSRFILKHREYFVLSLHREENVDSPDRLQALVEVLGALTGKYPDYPVIFSVHPRTKKRLAENGIALPGQVRVLPPLGFTDYIALQKHAACVISDSGTITEESALLGFPAVTPRQAHERPEGMDAGIVVMSDLHLPDFIDSVALAMDDGSEVMKGRATVTDYVNHAVSRQVVKIIQSYSRYVNRVVWSQ